MKRNNEFNFQFKMAESFYMTLPSNASMETHPNNTMANLIIELFTPIRFERPFEVALVEITLPSVEKELIPVWSIEMVKDKGPSVMLHVSLKDINGLGYSAVLQLLLFNYYSIIIISKLLQFYTRNLGLSSAASMLVRIIDGRKYVAIDNMAPDCYLSIYGDLADYLGFPKSVDGNRIRLKGDSLSAEIDDKHLYTPRSFQHTMFLYTNIIGYQYVGDTFKQLLSTIFVENKNDPQRITYDTPHYVPLVRNVIDGIQITIKDSSDELIKFNSGVEKVILKLHFRPRNGGFQ